MEYHIVKEQDGKTHVSGLKYTTRLEAQKQASALQEELEDDALVYVLDDLELLALLAPSK